MKRPQSTTPGGRRGLAAVALIALLLAVALVIRQPVFSTARVIPADSGPAGDFPLQVPVSRVDASLVQPESDLEYLGAFRLPDEESNGTSWSYGGHGMGYHPGGDPAGPPDGYPGSLFSISHPYQNYVSEFSIPAPFISPDKDVDELPVATTLQPFVDVTDGRQSGGLTGTTLGDIQYYPQQGDQTSDKLHWVMYEYYLPDWDELSFGWCELDFANLQSQGVWRLDDFPFAATSKYLFDVPQNWADDHTPGKYLAAGRSRQVNGGSWGPALYVYGPWNEGNPPPDGSALDAVELLKYNSVQTVFGHSHADNWEDGAWLTVGDKSAVIIGGLKSMRTRDSGAEYYGEPNVDGCGGKGYHAEPYYALIRFYDPYLLAEAARGTIQPHQIQPYAVLNLEDYMFKQGCRRDVLGGMAFDRQRGLLYVMEKGVEGYYARKPIVHVFRLTDQGQAPDVSAPTMPENLALAQATSERVGLSWEASSDDTRLVGYVVYRNGEAITTTTATSCIDDRVNPSAAYSYTVVAWDARDNRSAASQPLLVNTPPGEDARAPIITNIRITDVTDSSAVVHWQTDELATTLVWYGIQYSSNYTTVENTALTTTHQVALSGLTADAYYVYYVASTDAVGNQNEYAGGQSGPRSFHTAAPGGTWDFAPALNGIGSKRVYEGEDLLFTVRADDQDQEPLLYNATGLPPGADFDTVSGQFAWTPAFDQAGTYSVTFAASDGDESESETIAIFVLDNPTLALRAQPADRTIYLDWTVNVNLPPTATWRIDYSPPDGDELPPIGGIVSTTRAHTLTGLTNYAWYTVSLNAVLDGTPFLTDTVRVMPTGIAVYMPLVRKGE